MKARDGRGGVEMRESGGGGGAAYSTAGSNGCTYSSLTKRE